MRGLLDGLRVEGSDVVLGASSNLSAIEDWPELNGRDGGLLGACLRQFGSRHVRNMATVGGNLAHAVPSADLALPLLALEARCDIAGANGIPTFFRYIERHLTPARPARRRGGNRSCP